MTVKDNEMVTKREGEGERKKERVLFNDILNLFVGNKNYVWYI